MALYLVAFDAFESRELLRFISILYAVLLGVGLVYLAKRLDTFLRPSRKRVTVAKCARADEFSPLRRLTG